MDHFRISLIHDSGAIRTPPSPVVTNLVACRLTITAAPWEINPEIPMSEHASKQLAASKISGDEAVSEAPTGRDPKGAVIIAGALAGRLILGTVQLSEPTSTNCGMHPAEMID